MLLVYFTIAWLAGIFFGSILNLSLWTLFLALILLPLLYVFQHKRRLIFAVTVCAFLFVMGVIRYDASQPVVTETAIQYYNGCGPVQIRGTVAAAPDIRDTFTQLTINATSINAGGGWLDTEGKVLVFLPAYPKFAYGDTLQFTGILTSPQQLDEFDYPGYLAHQHIYSLMAFPAVELLQPGHGFNPLGGIFALRELLASTLARVLPEPQASLAQGILLGIRGSIPQDLKDNFSITGTTHILAISGVNLNIVAGILVATGIWLFGKRRQLYIWLALSAIWVYSLLTGFNPPVVRAAFIVSLFLCADLLGRQHSIHTALALAAGMMTALSPRVLWDVSFQLSFMAMLGLVYVVPLLQVAGKKIVIRVTGGDNFPANFLQWITDSFAVTLGVTIVVWPLIAHYFGVFSLVSPLATLLILPMLPAIMLCSTLSALFGLIFLPLGTALGWTAWLFLSYMLLVVNGFAGLPAAAIAIHDFHPLFIAGYFTILAILVTIISRWKALLTGYSRILDSLDRLPKKWVLPPLTTLAVLSTIFVFSLPDQNLHVSYLDVGQGDAILIQIGSTDILIDGGPSPRALNRELGKLLPFWDRTIELAISTHPHADHLAGLVNVLDRYGVQHIIQPLTESTSPLWQEWITAAADRGITITPAASGQKIILNKGGITIEILRAPAAGSTAGLDDEGIVLRLDSRDVAFLFTADISAVTEMDLLLERAHLKTTVLKVAHHGSDTASGAEFLAVVQPAVAVISVGTENDYGHPSGEILSRLTTIVGAEHIYRTDLNGTIRISTDGEKLWLTKDR